MEGTMEDGLPEDIWDRCRSGDGRAVERVVVQYMPLVRGIASRMGNLPNHIDFDELVSYGLVGLLDAIGKYDPTPQEGYERGTRFSVYANRRVRGAILDELRSQSWEPRSVRDKRKELAKAEDALAGQLGREPTDEEVAAEVGIDMAELAFIREDRYINYVDPLGRSPNGHTQAEFMSDPRYDGMMPDSTQFDAVGMSVDDSGVEGAELADIVATVVADLDERDRRILALSCVEDLTMGQIGEVLGVTQSRVCQLHTGAVGALQERLHHRGGVIRRPVGATSRG